MTATEIVFTVTEVLIALSALAVGLFVLAYSLFFDPTRTLAGKLVRNIMLGMFGLCLLALTRDFYGDSFEWALIRLGVWIYCTIVFILMVWLVFIRRFRVENRKIVPVPDPVDPLHPLPDESGDFRVRKR